jgi:uncharacterized protein
VDQTAAYALLAAAGLVAGVLNVVAGGGSFLTLPILIFLGLPPTVANATNRVGVLIQNIGGVWGFHRHRVLDWSWAARAGIPAIIGAAVGTWAAIEVGDQAFQRILAFLMLAVTAWTLLTSRQRRSGPQRTLPGTWVFVAFLVVGVYGGFVQAGVGFFILAVTTMSGLDLVRGNAVKVLAVLLLTILSLAMFAGEGMVEWAAGMALGVGNLVGGLIGVRLTVVKGHTWVETVVTITVVVFAIRLLVG